jgi:hypothetical protein
MLESAGVCRRSLAIRQLAVLNEIVSRAFEFAKAAFGRLPSICHSYDITFTWMFGFV